MNRIKSFSLDLQFPFAPGDANAAIAEEDALLAVLLANDEPLFVWIVFGSGWMDVKRALDIGSLLLFILSQFHYSAVQLRSGSSKKLCQVAKRYPPGLDVLSIIIFSALPLLHFREPRRL